MSGAGGPLPKPRRRDRFRALLTSKPSNQPSTVDPSPPSSSLQQLTVDPSTSGAAHATGTSPGPPAAVATASANIQPQIVQSAIENELLQRALKILPLDARETILSLSLANDDVVSVFGEALAAAERQKRLCEAKRWTIQFRGRDVVLRDLAERVVGWIDKVKFAGDIIVNADPVHAGLPWAGFRLLLEAETADLKQIAAILDGCDTTLYIADRLKVYLEYTHAVPPCQALENLQATLTQIYACVLEFLAQALHIHQTNVVHRALAAMWTASDIQTFDERCKNLRNRAHEDASQCELLLNSHDRSATAASRQAMANLIDELKKWHALGNTVRNVESQLYLNKIPYAQGAMYNSSDSPNVTCYPDTRVELLRRVMDWSQDAQGKKIFWLQGKAGTGKSTISRTVACQFDLKNQLGASFFFKRGEHNRGTAIQFFPTIVHQLCIALPEYGDQVMTAIKHDPLIFDKAISEQFDKLFYQPMSRLTNVHLSGRDTLIVIDALDECENAQDVRTIITLWTHLFQLTNVALRLFITSRPESAIRIGFRKIPVAYHQDIDLHEIPETVTRGDLLTFLRADFATFQGEYDLEPIDPPLNSNWPGDDILCRLVDIAHPLFIVAATISRFVQDSNYHPRRQLELILSGQETGTLSHMEQVYCAVLEQLPAALSDSSQEQQLYQDFRETVGSIVCLAEPLTVHALASLLSKDRDMIEVRLRPLHSVLWVPFNTNEPVRPLHLSFVEFLLNTRTQDSPFRISEKATHEYMLLKCLELLSGPQGLRENICGLQSPSQFRDGIDANVVPSHLSEAVQYAYCYWPHHAQKFGAQLHDGDQTHKFLRVHLLHWLEAMSLMNKAYECIELIATIQTLTDPGDAPQLYGFLQDLRRFVFANIGILNDTPLQIYTSALLLSPRASVIKRIFNRYLNGIRTSVEVLEEWSPRLTSIRFPESAIPETMAFSHDGLSLATVCGGITIWEVSTAKLVQHIQDADEFSLSAKARAGSFSRDGQCLLVAYDDHVTFWNLVTGTIMKRVGVPTASETHICAIRVSADGQARLGVCNYMYFPDDATESVHVVGLPSTDVALPDGQKYVRWHSIRTSPLQRMRSLSPDCRLVASWSLDSSLQPNLLVHRLGDQNVAKFTTMNLWPMERDLRPFVKAMAFCHTNEILALATSDGMMRFYDTRSGRVSKLLHTSASMVALAFAPDDKLLASFGWNGVELWNLESIFTSTYGEKDDRDLSGDFISSLSYDGRLIVHKSRLSRNKCTADILDTRTCAVVKTLPCRPSGYVDYSYNGRLLAIETPGGDREHGFEGDVSVWDTMSWKTIGTLSGASLSRNIGSAFSSDGQLLLVASEIHNDTASYDGDSQFEVSIWNLTSKTETILWRRKTSKFPRDYAAFSPDNRFLAHFRVDSVITIHSVESGIALKSFDSYKHLVKSQIWQPLHFWCKFLHTQDSLLLGHWIMEETNDDMICWDWELDRISTVSLKSSTKIPFHALDLDANDETIRTDVGIITINKEEDPWTCRWTGLGLHDDWITSGDQRLVRLPHTFEGLVPGVVRGNEIVLVDERRNIIVLEIDVATLEKRFNETLRRTTK